MNDANASLEPHQRIRGFSLWPNPPLPRTSGTNKLKRVEIASMYRRRSCRRCFSSSDNSIPEVHPQIRRRTQRRPQHLSRRPRPQLPRPHPAHDGARTAHRDRPQRIAIRPGARTIGDLTRVQPAAAEEPLEFPEWNRSSRRAGFLRRIALPGLILPLARLFAWIKVEGLENLRDLEAAGHLRVESPEPFRRARDPLGAAPRTGVTASAPAMAKEFFDAHFHPAGYPWHNRFTSGLNYFLAALVFHAFPLPQREAGTREALRYAAELASDGNCILIFPEGKRTDAGEILPFQPGVGMLAARLRIPVVPVRLEGLERVLHKIGEIPHPRPRAGEIRPGAQISKATIMPRWQKTFRTL